MRFRRAADWVSLGVAGSALAQLLVVGILAARARAQECTGCPQPVINQLLQDKDHDLERRMEAIEKLGIDGRLLVIENAGRTTTADIGRLQQLNMGIFVGLALNLLATIVQIRTQTARREPDSQRRRG